MKDHSEPRHQELGGIFDTTASLSGTISLMGCVSN